MNELSDIERYIVARWAYSVGAPVMDDHTYNILDQAVHSMYPDNPYCKSSWSSDPCPTELLRQIHRKDLIYKVILSDKTESIPSLNTEIELQEVLGNCTCDATMSMKHDGWNIQANYYNGYLINVQTRGRASDAMDITCVRNKIPNTIPEKSRIRVVMELTVSPQNYRLHFDGNANCRSAVSTALANDSLQQYLDTTGLMIHGFNLEGRCKFDVLKEWGFTVPEFIHVYDYYDILSALQTLSEMYKTYQHPTDGVVYAGRILRAIRLGAWEEPVYQSYVTGYDESYGPYQISPSIKIYPIKRKGTLQKQINITNWQRIMLYNLCPGSPIAFRIASDATADLDSYATNLLQQQFAGKYEEYHHRVHENERLKECLITNYPSFT